MVAFTGHKYLLGPQGTGGLRVSKEMLRDPHLVGGTGIHSDSDTMLADMPLHLEAGTGNEPLYHGLLAALKWRKENPMSMESQMEKLVKLRTGLQNAGGQDYPAGWLMHTGFKFPDSWRNCSRCGIYPAGELLYYMPQWYTLRA